jgi:hypothetical protein
VKRHIRNLLPDWLLLIHRYRKSHGYFPNLIRPQTFSEKILHRILFDRRTVLTQIADKAALRSYVASRVGAHILPELYCVTTDPETIPFDDLPSRFVVKPTHGSGWVQIVTDKSKLDRAALIKTCQGWLKQSFYEQTREWVYKNIAPRIIVEQFIDGGNGKAPNDYKLFVFGGVVEMIQVDADRFTHHQRRLYSPAWERLPVLLHYDDISGDVPGPRISRR